MIAGNRAVVRYLLERGADVNAVDGELHSPIHWATVCGELDSLDLILDHPGAKASTADIHGAYPLHYAAQMCGQHRQGIGAAGTGGKQTTTTTIPPIPMTAVSTAGGGGGRNVMSGKSIGLMALKKLLGRGRASVHVHDRDGREPLLWAASSGSADAILALCNAGASVIAADKDGLTGNLNSVQFCSFKDCADKKLQ